MVLAVINFAGEFILEEERIGRLKAEFPQVEWWPFHGKTFDPDRLARAEAFIGNPTDEMLDAMPRLRWIQLHSAGANPYIGNPHMRDDVVLTNVSGVFGVPGAEHAIALMLALTRQIHLHVKQQERRVWKRNERCLEVQDSTVVVLGLGDIGSEVARCAKGLGAYVIGVKRTVAGRPPFVDELVSTDDVDGVLGRADFVVNTLPLTAETHRYLSAERIARMKRGPSSST